MGSWGYSLNDVGKSVPLLKVCKSKLRHSFSHALHAEVARGVVALDLFSKKRGSERLGATSRTLGVERAVEDLGGQLS